MRYKFRGKRIDNNRWTYGYLSTPIKINCIAQPEPLEVFGVTIGQFTGLKDINGKDIYEGDVRYDGCWVGWNQLHCCFGWFTRNGYAEDLDAEVYNSKGKPSKKWKCPVEIIGTVHDEFRK